MMLYINNDSGEVEGPVTAGEVRRRLESGAIHSGTLLCVHGSQDWIPAAELDEVIKPLQREERAEWLCPHCGSDQIQGVRSIYEAGTTVTTTRGTTLGGYGNLSDGEGFDGMVIAATQAKHTSSTALAQRCAPPVLSDYLPPRKKWGAQFWLITTGVALCAFALILQVLRNKGQVPDSAGVVFLGYLAYALGLGSLWAGLYQAFKPDKTKELSEQHYYRALTDYEKRFYCHKCGRIGEPAKPA